MKAGKIVLIVLLSLVAAISGFLGFAFINKAASDNVTVAETISNPNGYIKASGQALYDGNGNEIILRGTNAGGMFCTEGWLEPYYVPLEYKKAQGWYDESSKGKSDTNALSEEQFRAALKANSKLGVSNDDDIDLLMSVFYENWFTEADMKNIADLGMNCLRIPFYWKNILKYDGTTYSRKSEAEAFKYLDKMVEWANKYHVYLILDLHGCPLSQNGYEHGGALEFDKFNSDTIQLWYNEAAINATVDLWKFVAEHYKNEKIIAMYDIMNEPRSINFKTDKDCWDVFDRVYKGIRSVEQNHVISMEGCWDFSTLPDPADYNWVNVCYQYHWYNWYTKFLPYELFYCYQDLSNIGRHYNVPVFIGEFTFFEDDAAWQKGLSLFEDRHYSWTCWTYKKNITGYDNDSWSVYNYKTVENETRIDITTCTREELLECFRKCNTTNNQLVYKSTTAASISKFIQERDKNK